jgi:FtsZ-binding cell division protein ZapB
MDFDFHDIKDAPEALSASLSLSNIAAEMQGHLMTLSAAFTIGASENTKWPGGIDFLQLHADYYARHTKMLSEWATGCSDHTLYILREQISSLIVEVEKFIVDLDCLEVESKNRSSDKANWTWRVRPDCEWAAFAAPLDKSLSKLVQVTRAIDWRTRALLELNPEKSAEELSELRQTQESARSKMKNLQNENQTLRRKARNAR